MIKAFSYIVMLMSALLFFAVPVHALDELPDGISFIALKNDGWYGYVVRQGELQQVSGVKNMQELAYSAISDKLVYVDVSGRLFRYDFESKSSHQIQLQEDVSKLTQIRFWNPKNGPEKVVAVSLVGGKSLNTELKTYDTSFQHLFKTLKPRVTVLNPAIYNNTLVYIGVHCVEMCPEPVQELWVGDIDKSNHQQITLFNRYISTPSWSEDGQAIYFSLASRGQSSIYKKVLGQEGMIQVTEGHHDTNAVDIGAERLLFLRQQDSKVTLMLFENGNVKKVELPGIEKIRGLGFSRA